MYIIYGINLRRYLKREAINLEVLLDYISQMVFRLNSKISKLKISMSNGL